MNQPTSVQELPCSNCGGTSFSWGRLHSQPFVNFMPDGLPAFKQMFSFGYRIRARRCDACGSLQLFA